MATYLNFNRLARNGACGPAQTAWLDRFGYGNVRVTRKLLREIDDRNPAYLAWLAVRALGHSVETAVYDKHLWYNTKYRDEIIELLMQHPGRKNSR